MEQTIEQDVSEGQGLRLISYIDMNQVPAPSIGLCSSDIENLLLECPEKGKYSFIRYM